ncbi:MAG: DUF4159 domain-containing protein [Elusimicrobiota bacterium]
MKVKIITAISLLFLNLNCFAYKQGTKFVYSQIKFNGNWDPHPETFNQVKYYLENTTSIRMLPERRTITLDDDMLFFSPFIIFTGRGKYPSFTEKQILNLRRYLQGGGILFIDTAGDREFSECVHRTIKRVLPDKNFKKIPSEHALFRSFYLIDYVSGLAVNNPYLEGIYVESRIAVIKSNNDLVGVWPRDRLGNWKNNVIPGKLNQRIEAIKLYLNIIMYSVCGTYKNDPVHQPYIKEKLRR